MDFFLYLTILSFSAKKQIPSIHKQHLRLHFISKQKGIEHHHHLFLHLTNWHFKLSPGDNYIIGTPLTEWLTPDKGDAAPLWIV